MYFKMVDFITMLSNFPYIYQIHMPYTFHIIVCICVCICMCIHCFCLFSATYFILPSKPLLEGSQERSSSRSGNETIDKGNRLLADLFPDSLSDSLVMQHGLTCPRMALHTVSLHSTQATTN